MGNGSVRASSSISLNLLKMIFIFFAIGFVCLFDLFPKNFSHSFVFFILFSTFVVTLARSVRH